MDAHEAWGRNQVRVELEGPVGPYLWDVSQDVWVAKGRVEGRDESLPVRVADGAVDVGYGVALGHSSVDPDPTKPWFLNQNKVSGGSHRGSYVKDGMCGGVPFMGVL